MIREYLMDKDKYARGEEQWRKYLCYKGEIPSRKDLDSCDALIISGSRFDAHDVGTGWIKSLQTLVADLYFEKTPKKQTKILGLCFGAQLIANAIGGESNRSNVGWELGLKWVQFFPDTINRLFPLLNNSPSSSSSSFSALNTTTGLNTLESHRDQILQVPPNALPLACSTRCPVEAFATVDGRVLAIQGHPEFSKEFVQALIEYRFRSGVIDAQVRDQALESFRANNGATLAPDNHLWKELILHWLQH
ncbi:hypothetical protein RFI_06356 [Reticulomyxa filosa]|uniref:Glutamine amidotransferase domain-containing protein n=1 Tax=Reticulomyxa filosa TaxID=46433 RepID=X6NY52_RETFI|nr:hypothetical protein RFI_06356 [Reticulomyxa filosa]|eukprot:ETO30764.1 hypothetical protein RFI_06356 [Reticulomyxa filosa]